MDKNHIRKFIYHVFSFFNILIPKNKLITIYGGKFLDDNSEAMFRYLLEKTDYEIICLSDNLMNYKIRSGVRVKKCSYFNTIISMVVSKIVIDSSYHTIKMKPAKKQLFIQCWHGSPLKYMKSDNKIKNSDYYSLFFYAAEVFKEHMKGCFCADDNKMYLAGSPRNDYLFENVPLPEKYKFSGKNVIWMPTFRHGIGRAESNTDIPVLTKDNINELNQVLSERNIRLYIKAHRLQAKAFEDIIGSGASNIILLSDAELREQNIPLYRFVGGMDALLTDYSSIYYDYLLLNRPIGFVIDDIEQYQKNRGFAFENPLDFMPGEKIYQLSELIDFFEKLSDGKDEFVSERIKLNELCNYYRDNHNCQRCTDLIAKVLSE